MTTAHKFDPSSSEYEDDWDARVELWSRFAASAALPAELRAGLETFRSEHDRFNEWVGTPADPTHHSISEHQEEAWGAASELESLICKALLEWEADRVGVDAIAKAIATCLGFYASTMRPARGRPLETERVY